ncbi:MAG: hypothetical protein EP323_01550 [Gammaproteobacteria bacterium]|nr:MAG: hypothetical protein EP323_01550 [Gammaproteobacteria bacterium]
MSKVEVKKRDDSFSNVIKTSIWRETPSDSNPYHVAAARCHGYDHMALIAEKSFTEVIFLLFRRELPTDDQRRLLDALLVSVLPGPRHSGCRAAMSAAVSKTNVSHVLPLALNVASGEWQGSREVFRCMKYLISVAEQDPVETACRVLSSASNVRGVASDEIELAPGFGTIYGSADTYSKKLALNLFGDDYAQGETMRWCRHFVTAIERQGFGCRVTAVFAAVLIDLGFSPYEGELLFQIACAPSIAAHAAEKAGGKITDLPFVPDEHYTIESDDKDD